MAVSVHEVDGKHAKVRHGGRWFGSTLVLLALLSGAVACKGSEPDELTLQPPRAVVWRDFLGINAHFLWFEPAVYRRQMDRLQALGLQWTRLDLHWDRIEPQSGQFRWDVMDPLMAEASKRGLKMEAYLVGSAPFATSAPAGSANSDQYPPRDPAVYANTLAVLAKRYPNVQAWQVWNEPNLPSFWRPREDPAAYGRLLTTSYDVLRRQAPERDVVLGGMAYYSQMPTRGGLMIEALASGGLYRRDVITAYHPYSLYPEGDDPAKRDFIARVQQAHPALRNAGARRIWADEWGWSSYAGPKEEQPIIGEVGQADYVLRRLALMSALDYDKVFLFALSDLDDRATPRDRRYGLLDEQANPKLVYAVLKRFLDVTGPKLLPGKAPAQAFAMPGLIGIPWVRPDGRRLWLFWAARPGNVRVTGVGAASLYDPVKGTRLSLGARDGGINVPVSTRLSVLEW
jgi:beta-xylosidase